MTATTTMPLGRALNAGLRAALAADDHVLLMGEDIGRLGGVFRVTEGLQAEFGDRRVLDTPLAESGIVGTAIGLAMAGFRPVIEIQFDGFVFPAFDQITTQLAKLTNRYEGALQMPVVIRIPYGGHIGAVEHHQESPEAYFAHTPGLRVVAPSTANDAYWMIQDAIASPDPVIFLEPKAKYWAKGEVDMSARAVPLHSSRVVRRGTDVTLVGHGAMVTALLQAAAIAEGEGTSCEVIDLRSLSPVDYGPILDSVRRTGHGLRPGGPRLRLGGVGGGRHRHGARLLRPRSSRAARVRVRCAVPAREARGRLSSRCRPHPRGRRSRSRPLRPIGPQRKDHA